MVIRATRTHLCLHYYEMLTYDRLWYLKTIFMQKTCKNIADGFCRKFPIRKWLLEILQKCCTIICVSFSCDASATTICAHYNIRTEGSSAVSKCFEAESTIDTGDHWRCFVHVFRQLACASLVPSVVIRRPIPWRNGLWANCEHCELVHVSITIVLFSGSCGINSSELCWGQDYLLTANC